MTETNLKRFSKVKQLVKDPRNFDLIIKSFSKEYIGGASSNFLQFVLKTNEFILNKFSVGSGLGSNGSKILLCRFERLNLNLISEEFYMLDQTLKEANIKFDIYFWDKFFSYKNSTDTTFIKTVINNNYEVVVLSSWSKDNFFFPSEKSLLKLRKRGIKIINIEWDSCSKLFVSKKIIQSNCFDKIVLVDNPALNLKNFNLKFKEKFLKLFGPFPSNLIKTSNKSIDMGFVGRISSYRDYRVEYLKEIQLKNLPILNFNTDSFQLSWDEYFNLISKFKITLNFSQSVDYHQLKARVFQSMWSKSLLLETVNSQTSTLFQEGYDYISFNSKEDLIDKYRYFIKNTNELNEIANNGYKTVQRNYNSAIFWSKIFESIDYEFK